ncbi:MAG: response regulator transcription factor [Acidobacteria bacterium]|nr:response regulator transcription factor [Acidobacteriota bacterium]
MIRVLITDDHMIVREGLRQIVSETRDISVVAEAATASEALDRLREVEVDVVVLDLNLPDRHGVDLLAHIQSMYPRSPVLILSVHREPDYAIRLMKAGAAGYVSKDAAREQLVEAIRVVSHGEKYLESDIATSVALRLVSHGDESAHERLTDREFQIMLLIAGGKPPREIASELGLSVRTIGAHRAKILEKTNLRNNAEIVQYALKHQLL